MACPYNVVGAVREPPLQGYTGDFRGSRCSPKQVSESQHREVGIPGKGKKGICRKGVKNSGNELKDLLKTKDVIRYRVQKRTENELKTNWLLRAKRSK